MVLRVRELGRDAAWLSSQGAALEIWKFRSDPGSTPWSYLQMTNWSASRQLGFFLILCIAKRIYQVINNNTNIF